MNNSILHRRCRNLLRTATVSRPVGVVHSQQRGHSRIVNVSRGYDKTTLFFNHQNQSPRIESVHGKGTKTNGCSGGNIATVLARGKADVSHESSHETELVRVQLNGFRDRLADIRSNVENHLGQFSNRISSSEKTNHMLFGGIVGGMACLFGTMVGLFAKIDSTSEKLDNKIDSTSEKLDNKIEKLDNKIEKLDNKIDVKVDKLSEEIRALGAKIDQGNSRKLWPW